MHTEDPKPRQHASFGVGGMLIFLGFVSALWFNRVNSVVTEPYLDEVFHIRQAQAYCAGYFRQWDPKITTPPGLYLTSLLMIKCKIVETKHFLSCTTSGLRHLNLIAHSILAPLLFILQSQKLWSRQHHGDVNATKACVRAAHNSLNICLFPPLFFFSALYYTDVMSTLAVMLHLWLRQYLPSFIASQLRSPLLFLTGLVCLTFRQTNIFWASCFPAMLDAFEVVATRARTLPSRRDVKWTDTVRSSWSGDMLIDMPVADASVEDYARAVLSIAVAIAGSLRLVLSTILPYMLLIATFVFFVVWNGGVVLGDKSNHVAALHLPQMLYIWPLIVFFSWPLLYPHVVAAVVPSSILPQWFHARYPSTNGQNFGRSDRVAAVLIRCLLAGITMAIALLAVRYNTIVHPFTLADNRHYVFYVFRLLLRHPSIRYLAAPVYVFCGWAVLQGLCKPCAARTAPAPEAEVPFKLSNLRALRKDEGNAERSHDTTWLSYVLAWLLTTTLTLVTAPLVEPRYFILPWITWRLAVPSPHGIVVIEEDGQTDTSKTRLQYKNEGHTSDMSGRITAASGRHGAEWEGGERRQARLSANSVVVPGETPEVADEDRLTAEDQLGKLGSISYGDHRLWLETVWYLLVNAVTGYVFLYRGFEWPQEPGKVQRFMW